MGRKRRSDTEPEFRTDTNPVRKIIIGTGHNSFAENASGMRNLIKNPRIAYNTPGRKLKCTADRETVIRQCPDKQAVGRVLNGISRISPERQISGLTEIERGVVETGGKAGAERAESGTGNDGHISRGTTGVLGGKKGNGERRSGEKGNKLFHNYMFLNVVSVHRRSLVKEN